MNNEKNVFEIYTIQTSYISYPQIVKREHDDKGDSAVHSILFKNL